MNIRTDSPCATLAAAVAVALSAQTSSSAPPLPRTSWGDPKIEGTYTNKDEYGTPFERPAELEGKQRREFGPEQMAELMVERSRRAQAGAARIGGSADNDTGAGPPHWYEHLDAVNSRPWFVSEPADGKVPAVTDAARQRAQARALPRREAPDTYTDMSLYDRCISIGLPGSMMPMIYGNAYRITQSPGYVAIRYEMIHETRIIPLGDSPRVASNLDYLHGRRARPVGRRHARRRDAEHPPRGCVPQRERESRHHRALHADRREHVVVGSALRGSRDVDRAVGLRDAAEARCRSRSRSSTRATRATSVWPTS